MLLLKDFLLLLATIRWVFHMFIVPAYLSHSVVEFIKVASDFEGALQIKLSLA